MSEKESCCMCGTTENVKWHEPDGYHDTLPHYGYYCAECEAWHEEEHGDDARIQYIEDYNGRFGYYPDEDML